MIISGIIMGVSIIFYNINHKVSADAASIDTSNWRVYRNDDWGVEVTYPENWCARSNQDQIIDLNSYSLWLSNIETKDSYKDLKQRDGYLNSGYSPMLSEEIQKSSYFKIELMSTKTDSSLAEWVSGRTFFPNGKVTDTIHTSIDNKPALEGLVAAKDKPEIIRETDYFIQDGKGRIFKITFENDNPEYAPIYQAMLSHLRFSNSGFLARLCFALGIIMQAYLFISRRFDPKKFKLVITSTIIATFFACGLFTDNKDIDILRTYAYLFFLLFPLIFSAYYHKDILRRVEVITIISYAVLFWFMFATGRYEGLYFKYTIEVPLLLLSLYGLFVLLFVKNPTNNQQKALLAWFLLSLMSLTTLEFLHQNPRSTYFFISDRNYADDIFTGMAYMYVALHAWYLRSILGRNEKVHTSIIGKGSRDSRGINSYKTSHLTVMAFVIIQFAILIVNYYYYRFFSDYTMMVLWMIILPQLYATYIQYKMTCQNPQKMQSAVEVSN